MTDPKTPRLPDASLETLFDAARQDPAPSSDFLARLAADAAAHQPAPVLSPAPSMPPAGLRARMFAALGGWPSLGGLATAAVAGFYLGFAQPQLVGGEAALFFEEEETLTFFEGEDLLSEALFFDEG